jgi:hypothetical protein
MRKLTTKIVITSMLMVALLTLTIMAADAKVKPPRNTYRGYRMKKGLCPAYHKLKHQVSAKYSVKRFKYNL